MQNSNVKELQALLKRVKYKKLNEVVESGMITDYYQRYDKLSKITYEVQVVFTMDEKYIYMYKDSTGGSCSYTSLKMLETHLLSVHENIFPNEHHVEVVEIKDPLRSGMVFGGDIDPLKL